MYWNEVHQHGSLFLSFRHQFLTLQGETPSETHLTREIKWRVGVDDLLEQQRNLLLNGGTGTGQTHQVSPWDAMLRAGSSECVSIQWCTGQRTGAGKGGRQSRAACHSVGQCRYSDSGQTELSAVCRKRRRSAVSPDQQAAQAHQPAPDLQPGLKQVEKMTTAMLDRIM